MQACVKRAMASAELLMSEVVSSLLWRGSASAMVCRMLCGLRGSVPMVVLFWMVLCSCFLFFDGLIKSSSFWCQVPEV